MKSLKDISKLLQHMEAHAAFGSDSDYRGGMYHSYQIAIGNIEHGLKRDELVSLYYTVLGEFSNIDERNKSCEWNEGRVAGIKTILTLLKGGNNLYKGKPHITYKTRQIVRYSK